jgi:hypothetical protein
LSRTIGLLAALFPLRHRQPMLALAHSGAAARRPPERAHRNSDGRG